MAYYDEFAEDPNAALNKIAERRNITPSELARRVNLIAAEAKSGGHLTLGQAKSFIEHPEVADITLTSHVDSCPYCKAMLDGLAPTQIDINLEELKVRMKMGPSRDRTEPVVTLSPGPRNWFPQFAYAGLIVLLAANLVGGAALFNSHSKIDSLSAQVLQARENSDERFNTLSRKLADNKASTPSMDPAWLAGDHKSYQVIPYSRLVAWNAATFPYASSSYTPDEVELSALCIQHSPNRSPTWSKDKADDASKCEMVRLVPHQALAASPRPPDEAATPAATP